MEASLKGKVAVVTGASDGIGREIARLLAREGARVVLAALPADAVVRTELELLTAGGLACGVPTDVSDEAQVALLFQRTIERFDRVDLLFNCAPIAGDTPLEEISAANWDRVVGTNLRGTFLCTQAAFRLMKAQGGGRIINVAAPAPAAANITSLHAIRGLTQATASEGHDFGIIASALMPDDGVAEDHEAIAATAVRLAAECPAINIAEAIVTHATQPHAARG